MVRLASNTATMVTTIIPLAGSSKLCSNRLLMKTLYVTLVDHRMRTEIVKEGNKLYPNTGDRSRYLLIPQDGVLSKSAELFNQDFHVVGRTCWADRSINASASSTTNPLFQTFTLQLHENMTITESCPMKQSWVTQNWTITSFTRLELPVTCKLTSTKFNCSAITLKSGETEEVHFPHHRMTILERHWNEESTDLNQTEFIRTNITVEETSSYLPSLPSLSQISEYKTPLICAGGAVVLILIAGIGIKVAANRGTNRPSGDVNINVNTTNSANNTNKPEDSISIDYNVSPSAPEVVQPPFNFAGMDVEEIMNKNPRDRTQEEQDMVLLHIRMQKAEEASEQN